MHTHNIVISIVIPIYNVEQYLEHSLSSVRNQTYENFEAILVNDGSTDSSAFIAEGFVQKDNRFRLVHQDNKGLSGARNAGLEKAKGDYVFYLDSDDVLIENALDLLVQVAVKYQADVVQGNFYYDYPKYLLLNKKQQKEIEIYNRDEAMWALLKHETVLNFAWGKLIKRDLAQKYLFPLGKFFEDTFWKYKVIHDLEKYVAIKQPILYYLQRDSAISGAFSIRNLDQLEGDLRRLEFIKEHYPKIFEEQALKLIDQKVNHHYSLLANLKKEEEQIYRERLQKIEEYLQLKGKPFNTSNLLLKSISRIAQGVKHRIWGSKDWSRIEK